MNRERYDWLDDPYRRRSNLRDVERAVRRGWRPPSAEDRAVLVSKLEGLAVDPGVPARQRIRALQCAVAMSAADLDDAGGGR